MAINFLNTVDLNQNQLDNAAIQNVGTDPTSGVLGQLIFNSSSGTLKVCTTASPTAAVYAAVGGGVETITWTDGTYSEWTATGTAANIIIKTDLSAVDGTAVAATRFLSKDNTWDIPTVDNYTSWTADSDEGTNITVASGNTLMFTGAVTTGGAGIATDSAVSAGEMTIGLINAGGTPSTSTFYRGDGQWVTPAGTYVLPLAANGTRGGAQIGYTENGKNYPVELALEKMFVNVPWTDAQETYTLPVSAGTAVSGYTVADIDLTAAGASTGIKSKVTFAGKNDNILITETTLNNGVVKIALTDNVTIADSLTVAQDVQVNNDLSVSGSGSFTGQVTIPSTPSGNDKAASKYYVDQSNIGQSVFQGGYNAATNTPDLDVSPATNIKLGWFWAVTDAGSFFAETVQPGDLIYANQDNPGATYANWVVVQSGQDIATAGASDGATVKGIAGFNSAHFNVTANGWVSSDIYSGGSTLGIVPSGGGGTTFLRGDGTWVVPTDTIYNLPVATTTVLGGIKLESNSVQTVAANAITTTASRTYGSQFNAAGQLVVNVPWTDTITTYSMMTSTVLGLGKLFSNTTQTVAGTAVSATASRTYGIQKNSSNQLVVNVPWVDTNTQNVTSVSASTDADVLGIKVTPTTGAVEVGLNINGLTAIAALADADTIPIYDGGTNKKISLLQLENHIGAAKSKRFILNTSTTNVSQQASPPGGTIGWVIAAGTALGVTTALDCAVEIIQTSDGATVYAEVTRSGTNVTINFSTPVSQGAYQAIVTRIY